MSVRDAGTSPDATGESAFATASRTWNDGPGRRKTALFRLYPGGRGVLQHVRTVTVDRGPTPSACEIDTEPHLEDVDGAVLSELRGRGFDLVAGRTV